MKYENLKESLYFILLFIAHLQAYLYKLRLLYYYIVLDIYQLFFMIYIYIKHRLSDD